MSILIKRKYCQKRRKPQTHHDMINTRIMIFVTSFSPATCTISSQGDPKVFPSQTGYLIPQQIKDLPWGSPTSNTCTQNLQRMAPIGDILTRCPHKLNWLFLMQKSSRPVDGDPHSIRFSLRLKNNPRHTFKKLIAATYCLVTNELLVSLHP